MIFYSIYALAGFVFGTYILHTLGLYSLLFVAVLFLGIFIALCMVRKFRGFILSFLVFVAFSGVGLVEMNIRSQVSEFTDEFVTVTGRVCELPYQSNDLWCYTVECVDIEYAKVNEKFKEKVSVYSENEYKLDDVIKFSGFLRLHNEVKNPGMFNDYQYRRAMGTDYRITSLYDEISDIKIRSYTPYSIMNRLRYKISNVVDERFDGENASLLKVIIINFRKALDLEYANTLNVTGVLRCLYTPYFHLCLVLVFLGLFKNKIYVYKRNALVCIFCAFYLLVNPYVFSARKLMLFAFMKYFMMAKRQLFRDIDLFFAAVLICGIQNPFILYNEGFLLSCVITLCIILFFGKIYYRISYINVHKSILRFIVMFFISGVVIMPFMAFLFEYTSVYSMVVSALMLPIVNTILVISPFALVSGFSWAVKIVDILIGFVAYLPEVIKSLPFSYMALPKPSFSFIAGYIALLFGIYNRKSKRRVVFFLAVFAGLVLNCGVNEILRADKPTVTFLLTGQGDCTITEIPYKCTIMVDGSGYVEYNDSYDVGEREIFPYLRNENIRNLDYVFVSHYHKDHIDGIISLFDKTEIKNIFLPDSFPENEYRAKIEYEAKKNDVKIHYISETGSFYLEDGVLCEVLYFDAFAEEENDTSVVMRLSYDGLSCLYTGDITEKVEKKILDSGVDVSADILKVAHHGSGTSSSKEFLEAVNPVYGVIMVPKNNVYDFPAARTKENFEELDIPLIVTGEEKCIEIKECKGELIWQRKTR